MDAREKLFSLEARDTFLFHGSPLQLEKLILKQPVNYHRKTGEMLHDGEPCVAATEFVEIAIFRAMTHITQFVGRGCGTSFGITPMGEIRLEITREAQKQLKDKTGYVYILSRDEFSRFSRMEWRSTKNVTPLDVVEVSAENLPWSKIKVKRWL